MNGANGVTLQWETAMRAAGRSERTITERVRIVTALGVDPLTADVSDIETWLADQRHLTRATRRAYTDALRSLFGWLHARGLRADDPTRALLPVRVPKGSPRPITTEQLQVLLARARRRRLRGYLLLGAYAGLRVSEIARVHTRDVDLVGATIRVKGKGGTDAVLPLHPALVSYARDVAPSSGWWFPAYDGSGHVTGNNVSGVIGAHMRRCGINASAHQLRHWHASTLAALGTQSRVLQEALRHANLQNVQVYTAVTPEQLRAAVADLPDVA